MVVKVIGETTILNFQTMLFSQWESETKICISAAPSHRVSDRPPATERQKLLKGGLPNRPSNKQTADQRFFGVPENGILCFMYKSNPPWNKLMPTCWSWIAFRLFRFLYLVDLMIWNDFHGCLCIHRQAVATGSSLQQCQPCITSRGLIHGVWIAIDTWNARRLRRSLWDFTNIDSLTSWAAMHFSHLSGFAGAECAVSGMDGGLCQQGLREGDRWHTVTYL